MICVIGSSGFLGSSLVSHFESVGFEVVRLSWANTDDKQVVTQLEKLISRGNLTSVLLCGASQLADDYSESAKMLVQSNVMYPTLVASVLCTVAIALPA
mgnify:CR=1 FL=1